MTVTDLAINIVCEVCKVDKADVLSLKRKQHLVEARTIIFALLRHESRMSLGSIADAMQRHHSTILHSLEQHENMLKFYAEYRRRYDVSVNALEDRTRGKYVDYMDEEINYILNTYAL